MSNNDITIYSTSWCAFCKAAMQYLDSKGIGYKDIDVEQDQKAAEHIVEKTGQMGVPVIEIGKYTIIGFDRPKIDAALAELQKA